MILGYFSSFSSVTLKLCLFFAALCFVRCGGRLDMATSGV